MKEFINLGVVTVPLVVSVWTDLYSGGCLPCLYNYMSAVLEENTHSLMRRNFFFFKKKISNIIESGTEA